MFSSLRILHSIPHTLQVLRLGNRLDIEKIENLLDEYGIGEKLNELTKKIEVNNAYDIFPNETRQGILALKESELRTFQSYRFEDNVRETYSISMKTDKMLLLSTVK